MSVTKRRGFALLCVASGAAALLSCALLSGASDLTIGDVEAEAGVPLDGSANGDAGGRNDGGDAAAADARADASPPRKLCDEPGLVARWTFDEGSGEDIRDCTSLQHDGHNDGGVWTNGQRDGGLAFDGGWVGFGNPADLQLEGPLSVCAWIRPASFPPAEPGRGYVVGKLSNPVGGGWRLATAPGAAATSGEISLNVPGDGGLGPTEGGPLAVGTWQHVCFVYASTGQAVYVAGVRVGNDDTPFPKIKITNDELRIGARSDGTNPFRGVIDDVRIYSRALGVGEIAALAQP